MTRNALVTGAGGQDGQYMSRLLVGKGYRVTGTLRPGSVPPHLPGVEFLEIDLRDDKSVERAVSHSRPDEIYNFAGVSSLREARDDPRGCWDVNARGLQHLLHSASRDVRICQASSGLIFGPPDDVVRDETTPLAPFDPYSEAKAEAHRLVAEERRGGRYAVSAVLFNHESPLRSKRFISRKITDSVARIKKGKSDHLEVENIGASRDWGFAGDYVNAMWLMLQQPDPEDLVIATGTNHSVKDLIQIAFEEAGVDGWPNRVTYSADEAEPSLRADPSRARDVLGWKAEVDLRALISMMVRHDLENA